MSVTERKCENCQFFELDPQLCYRYPKPISVLKHHWCGEHKGRPGRKKAQASET